MALKRLSEKCRACPYLDKCNHKKMECIGVLEPAMAQATMDAAAPVLVKHDYRDIKIDANTTVTIDLEDIKKKMVEDFYRGSGLMIGGA